MRYKIFDNTSTAQDLIDIFRQNGASQLSKILQENIMIIHDKNDGHFSIDELKQVINCYRETYINNKRYCLN